VRWTGSGTNRLASGTVSTPAVDVSMTGPAELTAVFETESVWNPDHYVSLAGAHRHPFTNWVDAATNIQAAVDAAEDGDRVWIADGTYGLAQPVLVAKGVTVRSANGVGEAIVYGMGRVRCVELRHANAVLEGLTLVGGRADAGGAVLCGASGGGTVRHCVISDSVAGEGGGVKLVKGCCATAWCT
jgi:hypothetical protein